MQYTLLENNLEICRNFYNFCLEKQKSGLNHYEIQSLIPKLKQEQQQLKLVYSKILQYIPHQLFSNIKGLKESKKRKRKTGELRFKGKGWYKTITYNQSGFKIKTNKLHLSKIGDIKCSIHRNIAEKIKQITIKKYADGKWFALVQTETSKKLKTKTMLNSIGIDLGIINFVVDSDGNKTKSPMYLKSSLERKKIEQQRLNRKQRYSKNRIKQRIKTAKLELKIVNQRNDFLHKLSRYYINNYDCIIVEDLDIKNMIKISYNARNIHDVSWSRFVQFLEYKAENAGILLVKINPEYTSQICSQCESINPHELLDRIYNCKSCGLSIDRDYNAAINILKRGLEQVPPELRDVKLVENSTSVSVENRRKLISMKQEATPLTLTS